MTTDFATWRGFLGFALFAVGYVVVFSVAAMLLALVIP